nr:hypothetical protein [Methanobrevibacter arboriphilus]
MVLYNFKITPRIWIDINKETSFTLEDLEGNGSTTKFKIILASNINNPSAIDNDIGIITNEEGQLDHTSFNEIIPTNGYTDVYLDYQPTSGGGFSIVSTTNSVDINVGSTTVNLRGIFLVEANTDYLLGYSIFSSDLALANSITLPIVGSLLTLNKTI